MLQSRDDHEGSSRDICDGSLEEQMLLLVAQLMEAGQDDEDTCRALDHLTKLLSEEQSAKVDGLTPSKPLHNFIDVDGFDTIVGFLDMRNDAIVRGRATLTLSAYLSASGQEGTKYLSDFFTSRVSKATYDDFIVTFSVAACIFPVVPSVSTELFLTEGFVASLGSLMKRRWKSKKVERACLEMLNAACMDNACREAINKYCTDWLQDIVMQHTQNFEDGISSKTQIATDESTRNHQAHSEIVKNLAALVLAKIQAVPSTPHDMSDERVRHPGTTSMEDLVNIFARALNTKDTSRNHSSVEGLAYASLQPKMKEKIASDSLLLHNLVLDLSQNPAKSAETYGGLTILVNLTIYLPIVSEEQKRMTQLKAYANASKTPLEPDPLESDEHVEKRGKLVFDAGVIPVLVTHSQYGSIASLNLVVTILFSLSQNKKIRGQMAQQGAIKLLLHAFLVFPEKEMKPRRTTAHALARILISTNPVHVFGGSNPLSLTSSIRPLLLLVTEDPTVEQHDLLPVFESLLALTNLASTNDSARNHILRLGWPSITGLLTSSNTMVTRATVELICNLMLSPEGVAKFADGSKQASQMMHIILALSDAEDFATRRAAGGALASLTEWDSAVNAILERDRGVKLLLGLCQEDEEELRHRGVVCVLNVINITGKVGEWGLTKMKEGGGVEALKECLRKSRSQEVLEIAVEALKRLMSP